MDEIESRDQVDFFSLANATRDSDGNFNARDFSPRGFPDFESSADGA
jgi:hypothetical protein